ncbi:MAG: bifunctional DNA primase/polymerase, partial [Chloroflexi bacterium]|nr:bifunctional DNA primase/polymerase [Chloroflexota bacterium]
MNIIELTQTLARRGWFVFPCKPDKTPLCNWKTESTNKPNAVKQWTKNPTILIGINCEQSGIFAIDIDNKHSKNGSAEWSRLVETYGNGRGVPVGPAQRTPSGGYHLIFRWHPPELVIPNKVDALGPGIDLRSRGYICTGNGYIWLDNHGPDIPLSDPPEWLVDLIRIIG